jgi:hypothetical protein
VLILNFNLIELSRNVANVRDLFILLLFLWPYSPMIACAPSTTLLQLSLSAELFFQSNIMHFLKYDFIVVVKRPSPRQVFG